MKFKTVAQYSTNYIYGHGKIEDTPAVASLKKFFIFLHYS